MQAAIATIAEEGYRSASFARIAKRAGLSSTGLISYHFDGRQDLIGQVVDHVLGRIGNFMAERLEGCTGPTELLRIYIVGNIEFVESHPCEMKALLEIFMNGAFAYDFASETAVISPLEEILTGGQQSGEFRRFDPKVMATLIQRAVDGLPFLLAAEPGLDTVAYGTEVATAFELATRANRP